MSRAEDHSRSVSGMTSNDDRLSGERNSPSEPSVLFTGIITLSSHEMPSTPIYEYKTKLPIMQRKYQLGEPLYRQEKYWEFQGIYLSRTEDIPIHDAILFPYDTIDELKKEYLGIDCD